MERMVLVSSTEDKGKKHPQMTKPNGDAEVLSRTTETPMPETSLKFKADTAEKFHILPEEEQKHFRDIVQKRKVSDLYFLLLFLAGADFFHVKHPAYDLITFYDFL